MSAVAIVFQRNGAPSDQATLSVCMNAMLHRGRDGQRSQESRGCALGYLHFASLPAVEDNTGPRKCGESGQNFLFCGRIDNRHELQSALGKKTRERDEELAWRGYLVWGTEVFRRLIGKFVFAIWNPESQVLIVARDALGDEPLYYALDRDRFIAASEPWAVQAARDTAPRPDSEKIVDFLHNRWPATNRSFFEGVMELPQGHWARATRASWECRQFWQFTPDDSWASTPTSEVHEAFREKLRQAVAARMRTDRSVGISLSGGLDSTSIAFSADDCERLRAFSWRFMENRSADEGMLLHTVVSQLDLLHTELSGDDCYTRFNAGGAPEGIDLNGPHVNTVHGLKQALYRQAADMDCSSILCGDSADELYLGRYYWLRDLTRYRQHGRIKDAFSLSLADLIKCREGGWLSLRLLAGNRFGARRYLPERKPPWLSEAAWHTLPAYQASSLVPEDLQAENSYDFAIGCYRSSYANYELAANARSGVERRSPYRDRRLVEFILQLPAWFYRYPPRNKVLVRDAFNGLLPESIVKQSKSGSLAFLLAEGLRRAKPAVEALLVGDNAWREYLDEREILRALHQFQNAGQNHRVPDGVLWNAICLQSWLTALDYRYRPGSP